MGRLFGTDGIRGIANVDLQADRSPTRSGGRPPTSWPGRAARSSWARTRGARAACSSRRSRPGRRASGPDVHVAGVLPTPALAFLAGTGAFAAGIMVSASHNPADDNGLKVLDSRGLKLDEPAEDALEQLIWRAEELGGPRQRRDRARRGRRRACVDRYRADRLRLAAATPCDLRIVLDCANGSGGATAPEILAATGATVEVIHNEPDGVNINVGCGATAPGSLAGRGGRAGRRPRASPSTATPTGSSPSTGTAGSWTATSCSASARSTAWRRGALAGGILVVTVLSNGGLEAALGPAGGRVVRTPVGDKYILEGMQVTGAGLGGEKSGHVIVLEHATSGDGIVTAPRGPRRSSAATGRPLDELAAAIPLFPQEQRPSRFATRSSGRRTRSWARAIAAARGAAGRRRADPRPARPAPSPPCG